jgi:hypothetical protein
MFILLQVADALIVQYFVRHLLEVDKLVSITDGTYISGEDGRAWFSNGGADVDEDEGDGRACFGGVGEGDGRAGFGGVGEGDTDDDGSEHCGTDNGSTGYNDRGDGGTGDDGLVENSSTGDDSTAAQAMSTEAMMGQAMAS